jgi:2-phosphoglycerate kinase
MDIFRDRATLHVFYGAACTGKSTLALRFAHEHSIRTIIHTDYVREVQKAYVKPPDESLLIKVTHNAWDLFGEPTTENIVKGFTKHVDAVAPALLAVVRKLSRDGFDAIVEGVHCYGDVLDQFTHIGGLIVLPRLVVIDESRLFDYIQHKEEERSHSGEAKAWKNHINILMHIQEFLLQDAIQRHIPIICPE